MINSSVRVLITGDQGFVGTETRRLFDKEKVQYFGYDLMNCQDIRHTEQLEECIKGNGITRILHLAAIARFADADRDPRTCYETNVWATRTIAILAGKYHIPLVYASTGSVYMPIKREPPITEDFEVRGNSVYGCSKATGEKYVQHYASPWMILRYAHLYGHEKRMHGLIGGFLDRINRGLAPTLYGGKQSNDFTYIKDVAVANFIAITAPWDKWNHAYNIGTGEEITAERAGELICKLSGYKGKIEKKEQREVDPQRFVYDTSKAEQQLGFRTLYDFEHGLKDMFSHGTGAESKSD